MSMSTEYVIERIDEAARFNTSNKQVCNDVLCLARGRIQSLQNELEAKIRFINELEDKLRKYEEVDTGWIYCKDRLPDDGQKTLVVDDKDCIVICIYYADEKAFRVAWDRFRFDNAVRWMPVPVYTKSDIKKEKSICAEEDVKLERGDYVICKNEYDCTFEALYLGADYKCYIVMDKGFAVPQALNIHDWTLTKTGKHIRLFDIDKKEN